MRTEKLYYKNQFLTTCKAKLIEINEKGLIFDKTVAYPEGGGQIGDSGILIREKTKEEIEFLDTTKYLFKRFPSNKSWRSNHPSYRYLFIK